MKNIIRNDQDFNLDYIRRFLPTVAWTFWIETEKKNLGMYFLIFFSCLASKMLENRLMSDSFQSLKNRMLLQK